MIDSKNDLDSLYKKICDFEHFYINQGEETSLQLHHKFNEKYTAENMANGYKNVYEKLLGGSVK